MPGYIKLYRDLKENPIWQEKPFSKGQAWIDLMLRCNHVCNKVTGYGKCEWVLRGQFISSNYKLAEAWGWSESSVRVFIKLLESEGMITKKPCNKNTLFEVTNYCVYQSIETEGTQEFDNVQKTCKKRAKNVQKTPNKNDNNVNNEKKEIYTPDFENFWTIYPRPQAKADTYKSFCKLKKEISLELINQCTKNYVDYVNQMPEDERIYAYSSNNFLGQKAYYKDFEQPKKYIPRKPKLIVIPNNENFESRQYDKDYFNSVYEEL